MTVWSIKRNPFSFIIMFCYFSKMHVLLLKSLLPWWTNDIMRTETDRPGRLVSACLCPPPPCCLSTVYRGWLTHRDFVWDTLNIWSVTAVQSAAGQWFDPPQVTLSTSFFPYDNGTLHTYYQYHVRYAITEVSLLDPDSSNIRTGWRTTDKSLWRRAKAFFFSWLSVAV